VTSNTANIYQGANIPSYDAVTYRLSKRPFKAGLAANTTYGVGISFDQIDFVGGKMQIGATGGVPGGEPIYYQNRATGLATVNNNTGADIKAAIKLDLYNAKNDLVWSKTGETKTIRDGWLVPWEYKADLPDVVVGYHLTATLVDEAGNTVINADTGAPVLSYTRYADPPQPNSVKLSYAGANPGNPNLNVAADSGLVATNPITATGTVYNDGSTDKKAVILLGLYKDGRLVDLKEGKTVTIKPEDELTFSETYFLPADVSGMKVRAFLWDPVTYMAYADYDEK
ncbi:MAG: hypothetical protein LBG71_03555, partial [Clostridiales Family XIII bacterium]|nr:hypothetical protein [Clostridiales Family XIII bacterium]